jgi:hypothetical protein
MSLGSKFSDLPMRSGEREDTFSCETVDLGHSYPDEKYQAMIAIAAMQLLYTWFQPLHMMRV